jgi:hypothetical protein
VLALASGEPAAASDAAHPGALIAEGSGAIVVGWGTSDGSIPAIVRIAPGGSARILHRFPPYDTPSTLAIVGTRVMGLDGYPESGGHAWMLDGEHVRTVYRVPDEGNGTIAFSGGAPAASGLLFAVDGGRGAACRGRHVRCGAIEAITAGGPRRIATFARPTSAYPLAGDGRSAWFVANHPARIIEVRDSRLRDVSTGGREAVDAAPFGAGAVFTLRDRNGVLLAAREGTHPLRIVGRIHAPGESIRADVRARAAAAYLLVSTKRFGSAEESRLYVVSGRRSVRLVRSWSDEFVQLHFVDARGRAVVSTEHRTVRMPSRATRGTMLRVAASGAVETVPLGALGSRAAVSDAIETPDGAVWSLLDFYGAPVAVVRSAGHAARTYQVDAGTATGSSGR